MYQLYAPLIGALIAVLFRKSKLRYISVLVASIVIAIFLEVFRGYTTILRELLYTGIHVIDFFLGYEITRLLFLWRKHTINKKGKKKLIITALLLCASLVLFNPVGMGKIVYKPKGEDRQVVIDYKSAKTIWNYLRNQLGCSRAAAAGVLGNMFAESEFQSDAVQPNDVGHGIGQWSWDRWYGDDGLWVYAENRGKSWDNLKLQLSFLRHEIVENDSMQVYYEGGFSRYKGLRSVTGEGGSAQVFFYSFEYGSYVSYEDFLSDDFEYNFATRSKRYTVSHLIYLDKRRFP